MLRPSMHERRFVDSVFAKIGLSPEPKLESESILHLMFQVQFGGLCTIIPEHFTRMPGLHPGTKALDLVDPVVRRVRALTPDVLPELRVQPIAVGVVEAQVTASIDGSFFGVHTDADRQKVPKRYLTYVYYFNRQPKAFTGGELRVYDDVLRNGKLARADTFQAIDPLHNRLVLFWARTMHEVMPVRMPSGQFGDARFTVNGWVNST